ncbi:hypothetical protein GTS_53850 [Gandjariella thermophila]|uniref:Major facilitator superfamily (MFS) profile domain-containing protein n=1 Tax=Gandjariella thermophila TaxID=1931992 RepID=A0A4D4JEB1_9PSEU|nr:hypothetical protein GTS_53850 [Gandjariella thermophila]
MANTTINTYQLLLTPDELRGRLTGVMSVIVGAAAAVGPALGGGLMQLVRGYPAVLLCSAGIAVMTLLATISPTLRRFPVRPGEPHDAESGTAEPDPAERGEARTGEERQSETSKPHKEETVR